MASPPRPLLPTSRRARVALVGGAAGLAAAVGLGLLVSGTPATATQGDPVLTRASSPTTPPADEPPAAARKPRPPKPATMTRKARRVPEFPRDRRHHGKRIVYDKALMTVWLINAKDEVVARYPVVGRWDRPAKGTYRIYSKSPTSSNPFSKVTFNHMVRFAWGPDTKSSIGFHSIPRYYDGRRMHSPKQLGLPIARGGCVRMSDKAAKRLYRFADVGDLVVVLPSP